MSAGGRWRMRVALIMVAGGVIGGLATDFIATRGAQEELRRRSEVELRSSVNALRGEVANGVAQTIAIVDEAAAGSPLADALAAHDADAAVRALGSLSTRSKALVRVAAYDRNGWLFARTPVEAKALTDGSLDGSEQQAPWRVADDDATWTIKRRVKIGEEAVGTLVAELSLRRAAPGPSLFRLGSTGRASIVDREGRVLLSGDPSRSRTSIRSGAIRAMVRSWKPAFSEVYSAEMGRDEAIAFAPANDALAVLVARGAAEVMAPAHDLGWDLLAGDLLLALCIGAGWALLRRLLESEKDRARDLEAEVNRSLALMPKVAVPLGRVHSNLTGLMSTLKERGDVLPADSRTLLMGRICSHVAVVGAIADRLSYAWQIETGRLETTTETVHLGSVAAQAIENATFDTVRHRVQTLINEDVAVVADTQALQRVLEEVISNAARYSPPESLIIVRARRTATEVIISIDDEGDGVDGKDVPKLFAKPASNGIGGMGLWLAVKLVESMGGRVWWEPEVQRGSTFSISLPDGGALGRTIDLVDERRGARTS